MKKFNFIILFFICICFSHLYGGIERRAAIDIGSGGTKVSIADVNTDTNKIVNVILDKSFSVAYQASLDKSSDGTFDKKTMERGLQTFKEIKTLSDKYHVEKITAVATSAFRKANNSKEYISQIEKLTHIRVKVISQREEGIIAFFSAVASGQFDPEKVIVWDIGTGSLQISTVIDKECCIVYMGEHMGSVAFKNYIIDTIQENNLKIDDSPNPMTLNDFKDADSYVRTFGRKTYAVIKDKIQAGDKVIGIGGLFYNSVRPLASENNVITQTALRKYIYESLYQTDEELNDPNANVDVSNSILVYAMMKALNIQEIIPIQTTTSRGLLISPTYWTDSENSKSSSFNSKN